MTHVLFSLEETISVRWKEYLSSNSILNREQHSSSIAEIEILSQRFFFSTNDITKVGLQFQTPTSRLI